MIEALALPIRGLLRRDMAFGTLAVINTNGYYDGFTAFLDHALQQGFLPETTRRALTVAADADQLLNAWVRART